jgi:hypothetical protein
LIKNNIKRDILKIQKRRSLSFLDFYKKTIKQRLQQKMTDTRTGEINLFNLGAAGIFEKWQQKN